MAKKKGRGRPSTKGPAINVKLKKGLKEALQKYVDAQEPATGITAVVEMIVERFLIEQGLWQKAPKPSAGEAV